VRPLQVMLQAVAVLLSVISARMMSCIPSPRNPSGAWIGGFQSMPSAPWSVLVGHIEDERLPAAIGFVADLLRLFQANQFFERCEMAIGFHPRHEAVGYLVAKLLSQDVHDMISVDILGHGKRPALQQWPILWPSLIRFGALVLTVMMLTALRSAPLSILKLPRGVRIGSALSIQNQLPLVYWP